MTVTVEAACVGTVEEWAALARSQPPPPTDEELRAQAERFIRSPLMSQLRSQLAWMQQKVRRTVLAEPKTRRLIAQAHARRRYARGRSISAPRCGHRRAPRTHRVSRVRRARAPARQSEADEPPPVAALLSRGAA